METNDVLFFPQTMSGIALDNKDVNTWKGRLLKIARTPFIGVFTSIAASLLALIQLVCAVVLIFFTFLAGFICGEKGGSGGAPIGVILGLSIFTQIICIANIATLGLLCYRAEFHLDENI